jgi:hypothetical protein
MATKTNPVTPELEAKALSVVASLTGPPAGFVPATPGQVTVGQVVSCWGHNKQRVGVVTEVTKTRIHVLFTTPGAITEAERIVALNHAEDPEASVASSRKQYLRNLDFYRQEADPATAKHSTGKYAGEHTPEYYQAKLAEIEAQGVEAILARIEQDCRDRIARNLTKSFVDYLGYTHSWKKIADCYVEEVVA